MTTPMGATLDANARSDRELVTACLDGHEDAWAELIERSPSSRSHGMLFVHAARQRYASGNLTRKTAPLKFSASI